MSKKSLYKIVSMSAALIGIGMILGQSLGNSTTNTAVWVGGLLILASAVVLGMYLSADDHRSRKNDDDSER